MAVNRLVKWFSHHHLGENLRPIANDCAVLANLMDVNLHEGPEKTAGMRKLIEAKDCFVRAKLEEEQDESG